MDGANSTQRSGTALLGVMLAVGLIVGGWILGAQIKETRLGDRYVTVSWWCSAAATGSRSAVMTTKTRKVRHWSCLSWVASPFANLSRPMDPL